MRHAIKIKAIILSICLIGSSSVLATPATDTSINKFIEISELKTIFNESIKELQPYFDQQSEKLILSISSNEQLDAKELAVALKLSQAMSNMTRTAVNDPIVISELKNLLKKTYSEEEILTYNNFLSTPEGKSINRKSITLATEMQTIMEVAAQKAIKANDFEKEIEKIIAPLIEQ